MRPLPFEALVYQLCQLFHCLPSQLLDEDHSLMVNMLTMHNTYAEIEEAHRKQEENNKKAKINTKMGKHLAIGLELEKIKNTP